MLRSFGVAARAAVAAGARRKKKSFFEDVYTSEARSDPVWPCGTVDRALYIVSSHSGKLQVWSSDDNHKLTTESERRLAVDSRSGDVFQDCSQTRTDTAHPKPIGSTAPQITPTHRCVRHLTVCSSPRGTRTTVWRRAQGSSAHSSFSREYPSSRREGSGQQLRENRRALPQQTRFEAARRSAATRKCIRMHRQKGN